MNEVKISDLVNLEISLSIGSVAIAMITCAICCWIIAQMYLKYAMTLGNRQSFSAIFVLLGITTAIVITVVKFSLALSLGLVGALSIVRFRSAIKEPEELVYLFLIIGIGISMGANQITAGILLTAFASFIIAFQNRFFRKNRSSFSEDLDIISLEAPLSFFNEISTLSTLINDESELVLKSLQKRGDQFRATYVITGLTSAEERKKILDWASKTDEKVNVEISQSAALGY